MKDQLQRAKDYISKKIGTGYEVGIILGTGLSNFADYLSDKIIIPYPEIPGFVKSTAPSHKGNLIAGTLKGKKVIVLQGRFHFYEGYSMEEVVFPTRVLKLLGVHTLIVTNAAGSLREEFKPGSIIMLKDHINFMGTNPLIGPNDDSLGERFVSMHDTYHEDYRQKVKLVSLNNKVKVSEGVYIAVTGPSFETKAECQFFANIGADVVGMSTVPEVITAIHCGLKVLAFSVVTNYSNLIQKAQHSQSEIRENADVAKANLEKLISEFVKDI
ncbi:purine-nucleoside phosphorylase [bacterium]|nr:purine-nucleoside phosphorylase [bacterium]